MTDEEVAGKYDEMASKLSDIVITVEGMSLTCDYLSTEWLDDGDPAFELKNTLAKLSVALASLINYRDAYKQKGKGK